MMEKVSRSDKQYKEIEKFKDYELTQCIAYEMAVRNPEIKELITKRDASDVLNNFDEKWMNKLNKIQTDEEENTLMLEFIDAVPGRLEEWQIHHKLQEDIKHKCFFHIPKQSKSLVNDMMENRHYIDYISRNTQRVQIEKSSLVNSTSHKSRFLDDGTVETNSGGSIDYANLFLKYSRPLPIIPTELNREIDLTVNLSLPAKDILAYVETIKKNYDKSQGLFFKTASALTEAQMIDKEIFSIQIKMKKKGSKPSFEVPDKTQQEVYADLLFLYDIFENDALKKASQKMNYFHEQMQDYYAKKVATYNGIKDIEEVLYDISTPRDQTIRELLKIMRTYIDDYGYKTLLA